MPTVCGSVAVWMWIAVLFHYGGSEVINIPTSALSVNTVSEYILFTDTRPWNTARRVCHSIGANLARVDSVELLDKIVIAQGTSQPWDNHWNDAWSGVHRQDSSSLVFDGYYGCSSLNISVTGSAIFKDTFDYQYENDDKYCLQVKDGDFVLEKKGCSESKRFICEKQFGTCPYSSVGTSATIVSQSNASATSCQSVCNQVYGCYMTGSYYSSHCVILTVPSGSNLMYEKNCDPVFSVNTTIVSSYVKPDVDNTNTPVACVSNTVSTVTSSTTQSEQTSTVIAEDLCPSSTIGYIYTATSSQECSSEVIVMSPSVVNITVTTTSVETSTVSETITTTLTLTDIISASPSVNIITVTDIALQTTTVTETATTTAFLSTCEPQTEVHVGSQMWSRTEGQSSTTSPEIPCVINTQVLVTQMTSTFLMTSIFNCPSDDQGHLIITPSCPEASVQLQPTTVTFYEQTSCTFNSLQSSGVIAPSLTDHDYQTTICKSYNVTNTDMVMIDAVLASIVNKLTLDKGNLSKTIREKISVPDPRPSSMGIGAGAVALTLIPLLVILLLDVQRIFEDMRKSFLSIKYTGKPSHLV